jgi:hypothetical protein
MSNLATIEEQHYVVDKVGLLDVGSFFCSRAQALRRSHLVADTFVIFRLNHSSSQDQCHRLIETSFRVSRYILCGEGFSAAVEPEYISACVAYSCQKG